MKSFQKSVEELWKLLGSAPQKDSFPMLSQTVCDTFNRLQTEDLNKLLEDPDLKEPEIKRPKRAAKNAFELQKQLKEMAIQNKPGPKTVFQVKLNLLFFLNVHRRSERNSAGNLIKSSKNT